MQQKALFIDCFTGMHTVEEILDPDIIGPVDFGFRHPDNINIGLGMLAHSPIPGTRRLIFTGFSELWQNFYISTMGGAAYVFRNLGINYLSVYGKAREPSVLLIRRKEGNLEVRFEKIDAESIWKGYKARIGVYALQQFLFDNYNDYYGKMPFRMLVTGPASLYTIGGAIASAPIENGIITAVDCWAGRGGIGSMLVQKNNIYAIVYGGDYVTDNKKVKDMQLIDKVFKEKLQKGMMQSDMEATIKYRYDPAFKSGGTLGVNFTRIKSWMFSFNYQSVNWTEEKRLKIHEDFVLNHYLKQFNEETIEKKQWKHCGEPCAAVCKKMNHQFKKDYEPYESMGPNSGIFDQRAAEHLNHYADAMGFDAIQVGSEISWLMELLDKKIITPEEFDLTRLPKFNPDNFDVVNDSMHNAELGIEIMNMILYSDKGRIFRKGIRNAAKELGRNSINCAVFNAFGEKGCMVPNQYWVPGMFSPMPIMGKYFEFYGSEFLAPRELGRKNVERMIKEFYSDNTGICRFHREWVEKIIQDLARELMDVDVDYYEHHKKLVQMINLSNKPVFWESERIIDIIRVYLEKMLEGCANTAALREWVEKFRKDKFKAAREYWDEVLAGINEGMK